MGSNEQAVKKPTTESIFEELRAASDLTDEQLRGAGLDVLHFVWTVLKDGGQVAVRPAGDEVFTGVAIIVPGLINPPSSK